MIVRRVGAAAALALVISACGGAGVGIAPPGASPTPPAASPAPPLEAPPDGAGMGVVSGVVTVAAASPAATTGAPASPPRTARNRPAYVPGRLLVKFRSRAAAAATAGLHRQAGASVLRTIPRLGVQVVRVSPGVSASAAMAAYRSSGLVEYVEQDAYAYAAIVPNDPLYASQWHLPRINMPRAWDVTIGGAVIVAVLDTRILTDHPDLSGVTLPDYEFTAVPDESDPSEPGCDGESTLDSHGTQVAGVIAARTNNGTGVAGVNWGGVAATRLMAVNVLNSCGAGYFSDAALGIISAVDAGARVINMSFAGRAGLATVDAAIAYAWGRGVTLVAAAGNEGCGPVGYPARHPSVIAVAATTHTNARAPYSNCGPEITVAAPAGSAGMGVLTTTWSPAGGHDYAPAEGTSMAAPQVAGLAAMMIARGITGPMAIRWALESTATDLGAPGRDSEFGAGLVNAGAALGGGSPAGRLQAFSGVLSEGTITVQSAVAEVASTGAFTITGAQSGTKTVFAWQDLNGNLAVDVGDYFGWRTGVVVEPGAVTGGVTVTVRGYTGPLLLVRTTGSMRR